MSRQSDRNKNLSEAELTLIYPDVRLAPHFPTVRPECMTEAARFFSCLSEASQMTDPEDYDAAKRGLRSCYIHMPAYDKCMTAALEKQAKLLANPSQK